MSFTRVALVSAFVLALVAGAAWLHFGTRSERRDGLWRLVHDACMGDQRVLGRPAPCLRIDAQQGYALVPGFRHADELLLVPTTRITGIEDPALLAPGAANYWADAWDMRTMLLSGARAIPRDWIGLAVNSAQARTQDQLHIHIDCVRAPVHAMLAAATPVPGRWQRVEALPGRSYLATFIPEERLRAVSLFRLIAANIGGDAQTMGNETLVVIGASDPSGASGFNVLRQAYSPSEGNMGHGEELLDHQCASLPPA